MLSIRQRFAFGLGVELFRRSRLAVIATLQPCPARPCARFALGYVDVSNNFVYRRAAS